MRRAEETKDAEARGGIESVEFLRKIRDYREANALLKPPEQWGGADVWSAEEGSRIRVCVRKRPMLRMEELRHDFDVVSCEDDHATVVCHEPKTKVGLASNPNPNLNLSPDPNPDANPNPNQGRPGQGRGQPPLHL